MKGLHSVNLGKRRILSVSFLKPYTLQFMRLRNPLTGTRGWVMAVGPVQVYWHKRRLAHEALGDS